MDDYLEDILDDIDFEQELLAALDDDIVWEESDDFRLMFRESMLSDTEVFTHIY